MWQEINISLIHKSEKSKADLWELVEFELASWYEPLDRERGVDCRSSPEELLKNESRKKRGEKSSNVAKHEVLKRLEDGPQVIARGHIEKD